MKVFVAGASGAMGRPLVRRLREAGHEVTGTTRSEERAAALRADGAEAVVVDVFDAEALERAVVAAQPEVVVHQLTALSGLDLRKPDYEPNDRIRREGTDNLLAAARAAGARRMVAESIAFIYAPEGDRVKDEDAPLTGPDGPFGSAVAATRYLEEAVLGAEGLEGVVLRYGFLYGPGTWYAPDGQQGREALRRRAPVVGKGSGVFSWIHVDDAATATVAAVEGSATGVYNVCDDEPAPMREWLPAFAEALGAKRPRRVPAWLARLLADRALVDTALSLRGASNERFKRDFGWQPRYASWRQGFREGLRG